ncbi:hypothetical protein MLD38_012126 [Melastoma candidum]|uniref:Uncharacterized protein n=1 Tax=Melastoma candidum TaxID=119954 RepID=A0ACB9R9G8_9MYRT|nr:hypothetical protein MLD38_012126 [Melastoma candidum]
MTTTTPPSTWIQSRFPCTSSAVLVLCFFPLFLSQTFSSLPPPDTIYSNQSLSSDQTLVSSNGVYELGFFSPDGSRYYLGIWYNNIPDRTYVWVANRDSPFTNSSVSLVIGQQGNVQILQQGTRRVLWSANGTSSANPVNPLVQLLNSGNFVARDGSSDGNVYIWQSFDSPTDTLLSGMKLGWDLGLGLDRYLTSWSSPRDPSPGPNSFRLDFHGDPEAFLWNNQEKVYRSGPWNGIRFSGVPEMKSTGNINFVFVVNPREVFYSFIINNPNMISRLTVSPSGTLQRFTWVPDSQTWSLFWYAPKDQCDNYKQCGPFGICDANGSPVCNCTVGFNPKNPQAWYLRDGSNGCTRDKELDCSSDGFLLLSGMKLPDSSGAFLDPDMTLQDCQDKCSRNCSCTAFATANISEGGSGCVMWFGELLDMRHYAIGGQDLYVKLAAADVAAYGGLSARNGSSGNGSRTLKIVGISVGSGIFVLALAAVLVWKRKSFRRLSSRRHSKRGARARSQDLLLNEVVVSSKRDVMENGMEDDLELPLFDFDVMALATNNFSDENKIGQGGFGCVYKGQLEDGQEVAVKRLSKNSGQGMEEFKNEVRLIARLQHINLVRLLGCCVEMEEKMLIYEYMENKSLDSVLFSKMKSSALTWERRFNIICGIARGLLYLHQDSRFRIIHRDLKASNILMDGELNPKISDFGMARIFGRDQVEASTRRVVGTYGYMSPEYAMDGLFSVKSDVFSFGVLVLEIVSGKKNRGFYYANNELNLLGHAWKLWKEGKAMELLDSAVGDTYSIGEVLRCIQVGLLCVQEHAGDRPIMSTVVLMLGSESVTMPQPKNPGFCLGRQVETDSSSGKQDETCTVNQVTVTIVDAR